MATNIKPEISKKNPYWIERHRYYELKHFCMQYKGWIKERYSLCLTKSIRTDTLAIKASDIADPTSDIAEKRLSYTRRIEMVEKAAREIDPVLGEYVLKGVTEGVAYQFLKARYDIPCCIDKYYDLYRKFFWLLDQYRQ